jgi:hypothetical protein
MKTRRFIKDQIRKLFAAAIIASFVLGAISTGRATPQVRENASAPRAAQTFAPTAPAPDLPVSSGVCRQEKFALFEGPDIGDIGADTSCPSVIDAIRTAYLNGGKPLTSKSFYYLSELQPFLGENYAKLPCFLKAVGGTEFGGATLVIDQSVTLSEQLVIPSRYTLAGVGINGQGELRFTGLGDGASAVRFDTQATNITIRDLAIGRLDGGVNAGIDVSRANKVFIRDVLVTGFFAGIYGSRPGTTAISVYIDRCSVFQNDYNIVMHRNAFHWRIRDCILNQAGCWGLRIFGPQGDPVPANGEPVYGNDHLVQGCRFESCGVGGALLGSDSAMLMNNRFEQNGGNGGVGIMIQSTASRTRLISNLFSGNSLINQGSQTQSFGAITDP